MLIFRPNCQPNLVPSKDTFQQASLIQVIICSLYCLDLARILQFLLAKKEQEP